MVGPAGWIVVGGQLRPIVSGQFLTSFLRIIKIVSETKQIKKLDEKFLSI